MSLERFKPSGILRIALATSLAAGISSCKVSEPSKPSVEPTHTTAPLLPTQSPAYPLPSPIPTLEQPSPIPTVTEAPTVVPTFTAVPTPEAVPTSTDVPIPTIVTGEPVDPTELLMSTITALPPGATENFVPSPEFTEAEYEIMKNSSIGLRYVRSADSGGSYANGTVTSIEIQGDRVIMKIIGARHQFFVPDNDELYSADLWMIKGPSEEYNGRILTIHSNPENDQRTPITDAAVIVAEFPIAVMDTGVQAIPIRKVLVGDNLRYIDKVVSFFYPSQKQDVLLATDGRLRVNKKIVYELMGYDQRFIGMTTNLFAAPGASGSMNYAHTRNGKEWILLGPSSSARPSIPIPDNQYRNVHHIAALTPELAQLAGLEPVEQ